MRTKTLLLTAAALLAAGIASSRADGTVYSQNVVGYASLSTPGDGATYYSMTVPFVIGVSNGANEVFGTNLPDATVILTWNGVGYVTTVYASADDEGIPGVQWYTDGNETTAAVIPTLKPGQGFFLQPTGPITNTFAGVVACSIGSTTNMNLPGDGATYFSVGSTIPFAGYITNMIALTNLPDASVILTWNGVGYVTTVYASADDEGIPGVQWYTDGNETTAAPCPTLTVGQGFFIQPTASYNWQQTLPSN